MESQKDSSVDPVTLEVVENRLTEIGREGGTTLTRTAASPVTAESKDLGFNILDPEARTLVYSVWMPRHGTTLGHMVRSSIQELGKDSINEGDAIIVNDPHMGALHAFDIAVLAPVHYDGQLVAWTGCATHHLDIGAMTPGWAPTVSDRYQEGIIFPPMRIVEEGELNQEILSLFKKNVRMPDYQSIDLKAQIAANNVAKKRIKELFDKYGTETMFKCYDEIIDHGQKKARNIVEQIPDGTYSHTDYIDFDGSHRAECTLTVSGYSLEFDFSGSAPQADSFINCAYPCTEANVHNILSQMLFPDFPSNEGTFQDVTVEVPEGTIFNCEESAPCSGASVFTGYRAQSMTLGTLSKAICDTSLQDRATAEWGGGKPFIQVTGQRDEDEYFTLLMSASMHGGGAFLWKDGELTTNIAGSPNTSMPNVESLEGRYPIRFLFRQLIQDSGGAGKHRGGLSGDYALKPHKINEPLEFSQFHHRKDVAPFGLFGGDDGIKSIVKLRKNTDILEKESEGVLSFDDLGGEESILPQQYEPFQMDEDDVIYGRASGGGGMEKPSERENSAIEYDLKQEYISEEAAVEEYDYQGPAIDTEEPTD